MTSWSEPAQIETMFLEGFNELLVLLASVDFWIQFGVIVAVFIMARWLLTPQLRKLLKSVSSAGGRVASFNLLIVTLNEFANTLVWLFLQWSAIQVYVYLEQPHSLLTPVASLLSAWLLIRITSKLVSNRATARLISTVAWTLAVLNIFGWLHPTLALLDSISLSMGSMRLSPLVIIKAGLLLWLSLWLAHVLSGFLDRRLETSESLTPAMRVLSVKLLYIGLITAAFLTTFSAVGIDLTALAIFGGALGVGLGFGLQKIFSNLISGVILLMDRSIKPGDVIAVGETFGWINHLSARYVSVITRDGIEHLIPNEILITERVENWSYSNDLVRLRLPVGIAYKADVRLAIKLCVEASQSVSRIMEEPEPRCLLKGFGNSSVDLELRLWINDPQNGRANVLSEVLLGIWDRFHEHGIEIPFPQRDLHLRSGFEQLKNNDNEPKKSGEDS
ncbi:MAG: mechanosensitive ion channel [Gammaproteobacteria bacterium]|jgi:small-conductance mechanosensitive channel|nr:mechanosensitive ion channel [Gammaproteobacteria bacterium]